MNNTTDYCSIKEASQILGVSPKTVQLWVENGNLRAWKTAGGHRRVIRESLNELLSNREHQKPSSRLKSSPLLEPQSQGGQAHRVLIVEDEEVLRRLYAFNVSQWSDKIEIDMAADGFEALLKIGKNRPEVLITDLSMPGMDGFKMLRRLYEFDELGSMLVIVVTSYDQDAVLGLGQLLEWVHVYEKPAPFKVIKQLVQDTLVGFDSQ